MALYDYKCPECHMIHAVTHSVNETPDIQCELCKVSMRKIFHSPSAVFPGDGWGKDAR